MSIRNCTISQIKYDVKWIITWIQAFLCKMANAGIYIYNYKNKIKEFQNDYSLKGNSPNRRNYTSLKFVYLISKKYCRIYYIFIQNGGSYIRLGMYEVKHKMASIWDCWLLWRQWRDNSSDPQREGSQPADYRRHGTGTYGYLTYTWILNIHLDT